MWIPDPAWSEGRRLTAFLETEGVASYASLLERAAREPGWFYPAAHRFLGLPWMSDWTELVDEHNGPSTADWYRGATTNLAWLAVERHTDPGRLALIWEGDDGDRRHLTYGQLADEIRRVAAGLERLGVGHGDVVTLYAPMVPEAVVLILACARIGAIVAPAYSGFGADALADRVRAAGAKIIVTADGFRRRATTIPTGPTAMSAAEQAGGVTAVVAIERVGNLLAGAIPWSHIRDVEPRPGPPKPLPADTPWLLAYTSGSSGPPKGVVHVHGGMPYGMATEFGLNFDLGPGDRLLWPSDMGWIIGPGATLGPLILGATTVMFEGAIDHPRPDRLWDLVEHHSVTHLGLAPTIARMLAAAGDDWVDRRDLSPLRILLSSGEPWTLPAWEWLHLHVGRGRRPIINWSGGTEIGGGILVGSPISTTPAGRFAGPAPGMAVDVVDDTGRSVLDQPGDLVITRSWPHMTQSFWNDEARYHDTYWSRFPDIWVHGDRAVHHSDGTWEVLGRSDDLLKVAGKRIGPTEYEAVAEGVDGVALAGAVGVQHRSKGEVPVIAITLTAATPGQKGSGIAGAVRHSIDRALGKPMRPDHVLVVDELPLTRSGKVHRRALRAWLTASDPGDLSTLANPDSETAITAAARDAGLRT